MKKEYKSEYSKRGSIKEGSITQMEWIEYKQTGMIRVKDAPVSRGELSRLSHRVDYYDFAYNNKINRLEELDLFRF